MKTTNKAIFLALSVLALNANAETIRFGVDPTYPPFSYKDKNGELQGFEIELGNAICAAAHSDCLWVVNEFDGLVPGLKAKKFDGILSSMQATPERLKQIDFSDGLYLLHSGLVSLKSSPLKISESDLKGKSIGVEQGTLQDLYANKVISAWGATVVSYQSQDQVYADLINGRLDASLQDSAQAQLGFLNTDQGKAYEISDKLVDPATQTPVAIGIEKGNQEFKGKINAAIKIVHENGQFDSIKAKYLNGIDLSTE